MDLILAFYEKIDKNLLAILIAALIGIFAWMVKSLIENPLENAKETFYNFLKERIQISTEVKNILTFITLFPGERQFKDQLQTILTRDGQTAYLDREILARLFMLAITKEPTLKDITSLINDINRDLDTWINKVGEENKFYKSYYSPIPFKRILTLSVLFIYYTFFLVGISALLLFLIYLLITSNIYIKIVIIVVMLLIFLLLHKAISFKR